MSLSNWNSRTMNRMWKNTQNILGIHGVEPVDGCGRVAGQSGGLWFEYSGRSSGKKPRRGGDLWSGSRAYRACDGHPRATRSTPRSVARARRARGVGTFSAGAWSTAHVGK
ncbi:hypothetical protein N9M16_00105 [Candidatus Dependentiae bacterium]|nr:hypothetical protein [Candidatus Dependentiae bacterium]